MYRFEGSIAACPLLHPKPAGKALLPFTPVNSGACGAFGTVWTTRSTRYPRTIRSAGSPRLSWTTRGSWSRWTSGDTRTTWSPWTTRPARRSGISRTTWTTWTTRIVSIVRINRTARTARTMRDSWGRWIARTTWFAGSTWFARGARGAGRAGRAGTVKSPGPARTTRIPLYLLSLLIESRYTFPFADTRFTTRVDLLHLFAQ